ncbi:MAG: hypothetical protein AB7S26_14670 [Sandaracinaceae bacterium]
MNHFDARLALVLLVAILGLPTAVSAQLADGSASSRSDPETRSEEVPYADIHAFDREFGIALYATGHAGSYYAGGVGGRVRWEPFDGIPLGMEAYVEATLVDWPGDGFRHDYPNGFNLYVPIRADDFRFRPFFGFCDILSFVEPTQEGAPRADDVMFGAHAGIGAELAVHSMASVFADLQFNGYMGHDRSAGGWTGGVDEEFAFFWNLQLNIGAQFHAGR